MLPLKEKSWQLKFGSIGASTIEASTIPFPDSGIAAILSIEVASFLGFLFASSDLMITLGQLAVVGDEEVVASGNTGGGGRIFVPFAVHCFVEVVLAHWSL